MDAIDELVGQDGAPAGRRPAADAAPRSLLVDGTRVGVLEWGAGPPVVLLHGLIGSGAYWRPTARRLAARGRRVLALDLPGHGESDPLEGGFGLERTSALAGRALESLGVEEPVLVGHSLGAAVAADLAGRRPVRGLVLASPVGLTPLHVDQARWALPLGRLLARRLEAPCCTLPPLRRLVFGWFVGMARLDPLSPELARELLRAAGVASTSLPGYLPALRRLDIGAALGRLRLPPVVVYGARDAVGAANGRLIARRFGVRPVELPETGHMPMIEAPYAFTSLLAEHV